MKKLIMVLGLVCWAGAQEDLTLEQIAQGIFGTVETTVCPPLDKEDSGHSTKRFCFTARSVTMTTAGARVERRASRVGLVPSPSYPGGWVSMSASQGGGFFVRVSDGTLIIMDYQDGTYIIQDTGRSAVPDGSDE